MNSKVFVCVLVILMGLLLQACGTQPKDETAGPNRETTETTQNLIPGPESTQGGNPDTEENTMPEDIFGTEQTDGNWTGTTGAEKNPVDGDPITPTSESQKDPYYGIELPDDDWD